jgi:beta-N-acetylhexosaminidase
MTDDLSMRALAGGMAERAARALGAGCDLVLHCNGDPREMATVAEAAPLLAGAGLARAEAALALRRGVEADLGGLAAEFAASGGRAHA